MAVGPGCQWYYAILEVHVILRPNWFCWRRRAPTDRSSTVCTSQHLAQPWLDQSHACSFHVMFQHSFSKKRLTTTENRFDDAPPTTAEQQGRRRPHNHKREQPYPEAFPQHSKGAAERQRLGVARGLAGLAARATATRRRNSLITLS